MNEDNYPIKTKVAAIIMIFVGLFGVLFFSVSLGTNYTLHMSYLSMLYPIVSLFLLKRKKKAWFASVMVISLWTLGSFIGTPNWKPEFASFNFTIGFLPFVFFFVVVPLILLFSDRKKFFKIAN